MKLVTEGYSAISKYFRWLEAGPDTGSGTYCRLLDFCSFLCTILRPWCPHE